MGKSSQEQHDDKPVILRGGLVVDGTGNPARRSHIVIQGHQIVEIDDDIDATGAEVIDVDGLVVAPGFIDCHTHYDAQILWDRDLTPSSWYGVTTVVTGNCGFSLAPTRPEHRDTIALTLENVEAMSVEALSEGIDWSFETFPQYLDAIDQSEVRLNVACLIGHTPLRLYVLGDESMDRGATDDELSEMARDLDGALKAGAWGFATSRAPSHAGVHGRPVPSRLASLEEVDRLAEIVAANGSPIMQMTVGPDFGVPELAGLSARTWGPVTWAALLTGKQPRGEAKRMLDHTERLGGEVYPQIACRPIVMQLTLLDPFPFESLPAFEELLQLPRPDRARLYTDPEWVDRAGSQIAERWGPIWARTSVQETQRHDGLVGRPIDEHARELGVDPWRAAIELALEEELQTRFKVVLLNDDEEELAGLIQDTRALLALSDAGAHASQLCDACFAPYLLEHWVRDRGVLTLEQAIWRLTAHPAQAFRIPNRGRLQPGHYADVVVFDPETIAAGDLERVYDQPAGADRLVTRPEGIHHVYVNGTRIVSDGQPVPGTRPGALLRRAVP